MELDFEVDKITKSIGTNKSYVIRAGRFTDAQKNAYDKLSKRFIIPFSEEKICFNNLFGNSNNNIMEIGFGMGISTAVIAEASPDKNYLGIEVHKPGIGRLLWEIENRNLANIRIIEFDAVQVIEKMIPQASLDGVHLFFPDPWPKKKHRKRRLIQRPFTNKLALCLKPGGLLYMATDWEDYAMHALEELNATSGLKNKYSNFAPPQEWRPKTKFEEKGLAKGHAIKELLFECY
ncbi:MAG: tRNA (guanosine(46)-N7)-methyltransferase TrmB [Treponema sp.]|jgi:tRNA (guanine-N7-)-methyltransferase|nr:tRNA (guanosine(46)-N7)-methyltransferase TrmB [Treponema sp.]